MSRPIVPALILLSLVSVASPLRAGPIVIEAIDSSEIEIRRNGQYSDASASLFSTPPIPVLEVDDDEDFLKIKDKNGEFVWVSGADVTTSQHSNMAKNCQLKAIAKNVDRSLYSGRGAGEGCK